MNEVQLSAGNVDEQCSKEESKKGDSIAWNTAAS